MQSLKQVTLLNLSPYGRSQVAEHVDWGVWFALQGNDLTALETENCHMANSNDYNMLVKMALNHLGVCLGWQHLIAPLLDEGKLVRIGDFATRLKDKSHYLHYAVNKDHHSSLHKSALHNFKLWILAQAKNELTATNDC
jgi:LysR family glycine cleavage system transcriptional activator